MSSKKIVITYINAGKGHVSAALALKNHLEKEKSWQVTLINPYTELGGSSIDFFNMLTGKTSDELTALLAKSTLRYIPYGLFYLSSWFIRANHYFFRHTAINLLDKYWDEVYPDAVISVMPWGNSLLAESLTKLTPPVPLITIPTDFCEHVKDKWLSTKDQYVICGTEKLIIQAKQAKYSLDKIYPVSGMIVSDAFYEDDRDKQGERMRLGLDPFLPLGIVTYGGVGSNKMVNIAKIMDTANYPLQLIFICGDDNDAMEKIKETSTKYQKFVLGFTSEINRYMAISDFFIGKPGSISITEALIKRLPLILEYNIYTLPQERYSAQWVAEKNVGILVKNIKNLPNAVDNLLANYNFHQLSIDKLGDFRAIFEIPDILEKIFSMSEK